MDTGDSSGPQTPPLTLTVQPGGVRIPENSTRGCAGGEREAGRPGGSAEGVWKTDEKSRDELGNDPQWCGCCWMFTTQVAGLRPQAAGAVTIAFVSQRRQAAGNLPGGRGRVWGAILSRRNERHQKREFLLWSHLYLEHFLEENWGKGR